MKAALFDLDGVVLDTEPLYTIFWGRTARHYRPDIPDLEYKIKGQTLTQIFDAYFPEAVRQEITQALDDYELNMDYRYIRGFQAYVQTLRGKGIKTAVVTSSNRAKMAGVYAHLPEFQSQFDAILTAEDFAASKPDPDCYLTAARRLGTAIGDCLVFEDSFNGLKAGRAAGMRTIGLATTNSRESIAPLADTVIDDYSQAATLP